MRLILFDLETTSAEPRTCGVVQAALVEVILTEGEPAQYNVIIDEICDPGMEVSDGAAAVHGITQAMIEGKRRDTAVMGDVHDWISTNSHDADGKANIIIAGHFIIGFDLPILWRFGGAVIHGIPLIDTLTCAIRIYPSAITHKLTTPHDQPEKVGLIEQLNLGPVEDAHSALGDSKMVHKLIDHFCSGLDMSYDQLAVWCGTPRVLNVCHFGKNKGKPWPQVGSWMINWICREFTPTPDMEATMWHHFQRKMKKGR